MGEALKDRKSLASNVEKIQKIPENRQEVD